MKLKAVWIAMRLAVVSLALGGVISLARPVGASASNVATWGANSVGQLGIGNDTGPESCELEKIPCSTVPIAVNGLSEVTAVAAGGADGVALLNSGTVMTWGLNSEGQLGDGTFTGPETCGTYPCSTRPVAVSGLGGVIAIATDDGICCSGWGHTAALLNNGTVMDWGGNESGQLGNGKSGKENNSAVPVSVSGISTAIGVAAGGGDTCALLSGGSVDCWGNNEFGELGNGTTKNSSVPVPVSGITNAVSIAAGGDSTCALLSTGEVECWGKNDWGQLGNGKSTGPEECSIYIFSPCSKTPVVVNGITNATAITVSETDECALLSGGRIDCWGSNTAGQLGIGTNTGPEEVCGKNQIAACSTIPIAVSRISNAASVTASQTGACAVLSSGGADCWGFNAEGQVGNGTFSSIEPCAINAHCVPTPVAVGGLSGVAGIASGAEVQGNQADFMVAYGPSLHITDTHHPSSKELLGSENPADPQYNRTCAGKPVNCGTGNESLSQTDLMVGGRGVGLNLTRTYNAQAAVAQSTPGSFGYGWGGSYGDHLVINSTEERIEVVQANGSAVTFYGTPGSVGEFTGPKWGQAKLSLNSEHTYVYTLPNQQVFKFNEQGRLLSEADRNGNTTSLSYTEAGRLEKVTDPAGRKLTFAYNAEGLVESVTDPMGHTVKYGYEAGNLTSVTLPGEPSPNWRFEYDASHRLTKITDGRGGATTNEYDASNRVISQTDPAGRILTFEYGTSESQNAETKITNKATGSVTREIFTAGFEPESVTRGYGTASATTEKSSYDEWGRTRAATDGNGHTTEYSYDSAGNRTAMIDADKNETKWTYNGTHDVLTMTTPDGETTTTIRDSRGNLETIERPAPGGTQTTKYRYNAVGEVESMTDPLGRVWKYEYDNQGDRTSEIDPEGDKRTWQYNEDSQETSTVSPRGNVVGGEPAKYTTKSERDAQGRVVKVTDPLGHETKYTYDADGNLETQTDPNGHKTTYTYNADNERTKVEEPNGAITETGYDGAGQVTSQTDGNKHTTKYNRNVLEQVTEVIDPLGHKTTMEYDAAGNRTKLTDAARRTTTDTYDAANRLKEVGYSDGKTHTVQYEYNGDGMRTKMVDGAGTTTYTYDQLNRLTESKDGHGDVMKYEYDLADERTKLVYPNGKVVEYTYDKAGRMASGKDWLGHTTSFGYDPNSNLITTTFPSGTNETDHAAYNEADQQTEAKMSKGTETLASLVYTRDNNGQVTKTVSKGLPGAETTETGYDANERLSKAASTVYEYDAANNPTKLGATTNTFNADDQLTEATGAKYAYDELGERTKITPATGAATAYGYDQAGNLISIEKPKEGHSAGIADTYTYNGDGLRASETIGTKTTYLAWDASSALALLLNDGTNSYIYGPEGTPFEQINAKEEATYLHHDQAGSTRLLTSSTGTVTGTYTYTPYGAVEGHTGTATTPLGYDGQYTSTETGLVYLRVRAYDPSTAQFMSVDPGVETTEQPYTYAEDNPLNGSDPTGLCNWNPFSESFWTKGNCISKSPLNPIPYYEKEIESYEHGCGYWTSVGHGIEGAIFGAASLIPTDEVEARLVAWLESKFPGLSAKVADWIAKDNAAKYGQPGWTAILKKIVEHILHHG